MNTAVKYCHNRFQKTLSQIKAKDIHTAFARFSLEVQKLDKLTQIHLYSATTQFLDSLINEPKNLINPLEIFTLRCQSIIDHKQEKHKVVYSLAVIAIALAGLIMGIGAGIGLGMLTGLWATPLVFFNCLWAAKGAAVAVAAGSGLISLGSACIASFLLFKQPKIKTALTECIETVKEHQWLEEHHTEIPEEKNLKLHLVSSSLKSSETQISEKKEALEEEVASPSTKGL